MVSQVRNPRVDLEAIKRAFEFSYHAHDTQKRASGEAYIAHPVAVARIVSDIGLDEASIMSALLHDTVEDTPKTLQDIRTTFTPEIATLVDGVTKLSQLEKKNRRSESRNDYPTSGKFTQVDPSDGGGYSRLVD